MLKTGVTVYCPDFGCGFFGQAVFNQKFHLNKSHVPESSHMIKASL